MLIVAQVVGAFLVAVVVSYVAATGVGLYFSGMDVGIVEAQALRLLRA